MKIAVLAGDGIGPEIVAAGACGCSTRSTLTASRLERSALVGGAAYEAHGDPLPRATLALAQARRRGAVRRRRRLEVRHAARAAAPRAGDPRPAQGARPVRQPAPGDAAIPELDARVDACKPEVVAGLDILIIRELTGDIYFGQPRGRARQRAAASAKASTRCATREPEIERIAHVALRGRAQAQQAAVPRRQGQRARDHPVLARRRHRGPRASIPTSSSTTCTSTTRRCSWCARRSSSTSIVTGNMFGDILSDEAAMLTGSIGMLPSASLDADGKGLYEPIHGSRARHRRQGRRQSAGDDPVRRHDAALHLQPAGSRRSHRAGGAGRARVRACARPTSAAEGTTKVGTQRDGRRGGGRARRQTDDHQALARSGSSRPARPMRRTELETTRLDETNTHGTHRIGRLARHGRLRAAGAHAGRGRLRPDRAASSSRTSDRRRPRRPRSAQERDPAAGRQRHRRRSKRCDVDHHLPGRRLHQRRLSEAARRRLERLLDRRRHRRCACRTTRSSSSTRSTWP